MGQNFGNALKFGRRYPLRSKLHIGSYLGSKLPAPPPTVDWSLAMTQDWGMMANGPAPDNPPAEADGVGDCTCAMAGHGIQVITSNMDGLVSPTAAQVIQLYQQSGFVPGDPSTDQGWTLDGVLSAVKSGGLAGVKIDAFGDLDLSVMHAMQAIHLFGGACLGVVITQQDITAFQAGGDWVTTDVSEVLGGHAIFAPKYDAHGPYVLTWGKLQRASWNWYLSHCDEMKAAIFWPWVQNSVGTDPDGFNRQQLEADLLIA